MTTTPTFVAFDTEGFEVTDQVSWSVPFARYGALDDGDIIVFFFQLSTIDSDPDRDPSAGDDAQFIFDGAPEAVAKSAFYYEGAVLGGNRYTRRGSVFYEQITAPSDHDPFYEVGIDFDNSSWSGPVGGLNFQCGYCVYRGTGSYNFQFQTNGSSALVGDRKTSPQPGSLIAGDLVVRGHATTSLGTIGAPAGHTSRYYLTPTGPGALRCADDADPAAELVWTSTATPLGAWTLRLYQDTPPSTQNIHTFDAHLRDYVPSGQLIIP